MALDRQCTNLYYLTGRLVAVIERSNGKDLSVTQKDNIIENPSLYVTKYDMHKNNMLNEKREIYDLMPADGLPSTMSPEDNGRFWIGYHHQSNALPYIEVSHHQPQRITDIHDNIIKDLHK